MVSIVLVNWNAGGQLRECLASLAPAQGPGARLAEVVVVDNGSTDGSLRGIEELGLPLRLLRNQENRGFAAACNQGAALATGEFLLFLNPDTRLDADSLRAPLAFLRAPANDHVGIVGIQLLDEAGRVSRSCARFPTLGTFLVQALGLNRLPGLRGLSLHMADWAHDATATVDHVIGAFYLLRRSLFESLGGFDERFFVYLEDLDLSLRARRAGYGSVYLAEARAFHAGGGASRQAPARRLHYALSSRLLYGFKHFRPWQAWALLVVTLGLEPLTRAGFALARGSLSGLEQTVEAYALLLRGLPSLLARRRQ